MLLCTEVSDPCTEKEANELKCPDAGFYRSVSGGQIRVIRCYCFKGLDKRDKSKRPCEKKEVKQCQKEK